MQSRPLLRTAFAIAAFLIFGAAACIANNNLFLPGDAFFPTLLTKDEIAELRKKNLEHARSNTSRLTKRVRQCAVMLAMRTQLSLQWTTHLQKTWIGFIRN